RALDVEDLALEKEDGLEAALAALLGRAARRLTLDDVELAELGVALLAVGELAGEVGELEGTLALDHLAGLARRLSRARRHHRLGHQRLGILGVALAVDGELLSDGGVDGARDLGGDQLVLG